MADNVNLSSSGLNETNFDYILSSETVILNVSYRYAFFVIKMFNWIGPQVITKQLNSTNGQIDRSRLTSATYLVKVTSDDQVKIIKVIKR